MAHLSKICKQFQNIAIPCHALMVGGRASEAEVSLMHSERVGLKQDLGEIEDEEWGGILAAFGIRGHSRDLHN